jgi:hypothetical protein
MRPAEPPVTCLFGEKSWAMLIFDVDTHALEDGVHDILAAKMEDELHREPQVLSFDWVLEAVHQVCAAL